MGSEDYDYTVTPPITRTGTWTGTWGTGTTNINHIMLGFSETFQASPIADKFIATLLALCLLVGTPANVLALSFFSFKQKSEGLLLVLYVAISCTDSFICLSHLPVMLSLYNKRQPILFDNITFCDFWECLFNVLPHFSMFLVMLMTVTRTIAIIQPFRLINKTHILCCIAGYAALLVLIVILKYIFETGWYVVELGYCIGTQNPRYSRTGWVHIVNLLLVLQVAVPSVVIFISFLLSTTRLLNLRRTNPHRGSMKVRNKVSVTIAMFTALFLIWNFPLFINVFLLLITEVGGGAYPEPFFTSHFMGGYSWLIAKILFVVLNATSNPILYMVRMKGFSEWVGLRVRAQEQGKVKNNFKYLMPITQALTLNPAVKQVRG